MVRKKKNVYYYRNPRFEDFAISLPTCEEPQIIDTPMPKRKIKEEDLNLIIAAEPALDQRHRRAFPVPHLDPHAPPSRAINGWANMGNEVGTSSPTFCLSIPIGVAAWGEKKTTIRNDGAFFGPKHFFR